MPEPTELARLTPEVHSLARPSVRPLIAARGVVQRSEPVRALFVQAKAEGWTSEQLAGAITPFLTEALECEPQEAIEVAQYLADEFAQIGDAVLLCDRTTGKAIARITEEDIYQPPKQRREGSTELATPLKRLNPNLEGFLVSYIFEEARDREMVTAIQARLPQSDFLREVGDDRLNPITRAGRTRVTQAVRDALPDLLVGVQGAGRTFLDLFPVSSSTEVRAGCTSLAAQMAKAEGRQLIVDPKSMNLRFSWESTLKARIGAGWVRDIAAQLVNEARTGTRKDLRLSVPYSLLGQEHIEGMNLWVGDPASCLAIQRIAPSNKRPAILPCAPEFSGVVGLSTLGPVGAVVVAPNSYSFVTREIHGHWENLAEMVYTLCVDWTRVRYMEVTDLPVEARAEIL